MDLSIVIPAYNEEKRLKASLAGLRRFVKRRGLDCEVLVVDDGSTDGTAALVKREARAFRQLTLLSNPRNLGKGAAVALGVRRARGRRILFMDADLSTPVEEFFKLSAMLDAGADVVIGSRALQRGLVLERQPLFRELAGRFFNLMVRLLAVGGFKDTQCGFKLFRAFAGKELFRLQKIPRFGFDVEFLYLAVKAGYKVRECPVRWRDSPDTRVSLKEGLRPFFDLVRIRWMDFRGLYK